MSTANRSARVEAIFAGALERPSAERPAFLDEACSGDAALREDIEGLLQAHDEAGTFLERPASPSSLDGHDEAAPPPLGAGTMLGAFEITAQLGAGGMATVYSARDTRLNRSVAIKVLTPRPELGEGGRKRFEREALAISRLSHPHICALYDVGRAKVPETDDELSYLVMERVDGETLADLVTRAPLPLTRAVQFAVEIAEALACAHAEGIVHRDLKPQNIMVTKTGTKLLDFGLASFSPGSAGLGSVPTVLTRPGIMVGTVQYMAPEQVQGLEADARADLFSLGLVLYEMLAGRRAFSRPTTVETLHAILHDEPPPLPDSIPAGLRTLVAHCLEKDRTLRFQTARDVAFALRTFALSAPAERQPRGRDRRRWVGAAAGAVALVVAALWAARVLPREPLNPVQYKLVPFAVDAAQETDPAWSPDGKSVAFVRTDVTGEPQVVVRSAGSEVTTALTSGPSGASRPFWSKDGSRIFFGTSPVRSVSVTGGSVRTEFPDVTAADISPDGKTFAIWRTTVSGGHTFSSLWTGPREGPFIRYDPAPFKVNGGKVPNIVRFAPDGSTILLSLATRGIWLVPFPSMPGHPPQHLFGDRFGDGSGAAWMPDSRHVVISDGAGLWLGDTRTGGTIRLFVGTRSALAPAIAPAGDRLLFFDAGESSDVVELSLSGGKPKVLAGTSLHAGSAAWSPRGDRLAYVTDRRGPDEIWTRTREELSDQLLVRPEDFPDPPPDRIHSVRYSPDGERLSFATAAATPDGAFRSRLWVMPSRGGTPRPLTREDEEVERAGWMPDGKSLIARVHNEGQVGVWEISLDTGLPYRQLRLPPDVHVWHLEPSPSGAWIAGVGWIHQPLSGSTIVFARDGSQVRELAPLGSAALLWSRDERTIYGVAEENGASVLRSLDIATGHVTTVAGYGAKLELREPINDTLQFMATPDGQGFVTTSFERRYDIWMLKDFRLPRESWWPWR